VGISSWDDMGGGGGSEAGGPASEAKKPRKPGQMRQGQPATKAAGGAAPNRGPAVQHGVPVRVKEIGAEGNDVAGPALQSGVSPTKKGRYNPGRYVRVSDDSFIDELMFASPPKDKASAPPPVVLSKDKLRDGNVRCVPS